MKKYFKTIVNYCLLIFIALPLLFINAAKASPWTMLESAGDKAQYDTTVTMDSYFKLVGRFISFFLSIIGVIFICLFVYAGYIWLMARDNAQEADKAKLLMRNAVIGLLISVSAYAITYFTVLYLSKGLIT